MRIAWGIEGCENVQHPGLRIGVRRIPSEGKFEEFVGIKYEIGVFGKKSF
ncbi:MAG TPA: hypothetical protein VJC11_03385 [Patescibacteria group bacterium]|nr:hypothetical protein [Patescibacteria group bacterium]